MPLDEFFAERIFDPLGMTDTAFSVADADARPAGRALHARPRARGRPCASTRWATRPSQPPAFLSGGGGLVSTAADYHRFAQMLLNGGELDGVRLLGPAPCATWRRTTCRAAPISARSGGRCSPRRRSTASASGSACRSPIDPVKAKVPGSVGDFGWGGAASTAFWVDPVEDITACS